MVWLYAVLLKSHLEKLYFFCRIFFMGRSERIEKSEAARLRRSRVRDIINTRINNIYSKLHRLRIKRKKIKN